MKGCYNRGLPAPLYFWRDRGGHEVDVLIECSDGLQPVEIKSGQTLTHESFTGLRRWLALAGDTARDPLLIYGGEESRMHTGVRVLPWFDATVQE